MYSESKEVYDVSKAFDRIEQELIDSMQRNLRRHLTEELKEGFDWSMWQAEQLKSLRRYRMNNKKYNKEFKRLNKLIDKLISQSYIQGNLDTEIEILQAIENGAELKQVGQFFGVNERKIDAMIKATKKDMVKAEHAVLRKAEDDYRQIIFDAQVYATSGAGTPQQSVNMAVKDCVGRGIQCIEYKNGAMHTIADYADMVIRTTSKRAYHAGEGNKRQEWGCSLVIMNRRGAGARNSGSKVCHKCAEWAGKVLIDDVWSGGKKEDGNYPLMSYAISQGLYHPRCQDSHTTYFDDFDAEYDRETYTDTELEDIRNGVKEHNKKITRSNYRKDYS